MCAKKNTKNSLVDFIIFIYLVLLNLGGFNVVKFGDAIDVRGIISLVTSRLAVGTRNYRNLYAMRLHHPGSGESYWLHQDTTMYQVQSGSIPHIIFQHRYILFLFSIFSIHSIQGAREVRAKASALRMEVRASSALSSSESE